MPQLDSKQREMIRQHRENGDARSPSTPECVWDSSALARCMEMFVVLETRKPQRGATQVNTDGPGTSRKSGKPKFQRVTAWMELPAT